MAIPLSKTGRFEGPEAYYEAAYLIVTESDYVMVAAKTPTMLLPQEKESFWRRKYFEIANQRIKKGLPTTYVFSLPETLAKLKEIKDKVVFEKTLESWRELVSLKTFDLKYLPHSDFRSIVYGNQHLAIAIKDPVTSKSMATVVYPLSESQKLMREFEELNRNAVRINAKNLAKITSFQE